MSLQSTSLRRWKVGDIALARVCKKFYAKVQVVKNEDGLFHDVKVLGITEDENGVIVTKELCYYVEMVRYKQQMWLPYTSLQLAERSRPFYGSSPSIKTPVTKPVLEIAHKKRIIKKDHVVPFNVNSLKSEEPDLNISSGLRQQSMEEEVEEENDDDEEEDYNDDDEEEEEGEDDDDSDDDEEEEEEVDDEGDGDHDDDDDEDDDYNYPIFEGVEKEDRDNAFKHIVRLGKDHLFDYYYSILCHEREKNKDILNNLGNVGDANKTSEDRFEMVIQNIITVKEVENYFHHCWRHRLIDTQIRKPKTPVSPDNMDSSSSSELNLSNIEMEDTVTVHAPWCLVCGGSDLLWECTKCPASFHLACRSEWLVNIIHRQSQPKNTQNPVTIVEKIMSSTRTVCSVEEEEESLEICPSCKWGPEVGYDDVVWHKLSTCSWWPARILNPFNIPSCLLAEDHCPNELPLRYYGTLNHSWSDTSKMCVFLPKHTDIVQANDEMLRKAMWDACDDYISVYLV
ncbi:uncharacterized protein LOC112050471 isoform X2 [Bicyclus anynana]|uniref:Uncharacterized protein LOC112050471 isoform X2 n=1 Tax=Bicyclus anynana TaxID=110368 RepID=A0A6J1N9U9_BICAN|nr:uncharacterized protein LOC112050471 isoform X2 [Bicyclus anynana]